MTKDVEKDKARLRALLAKALDDGATAAERESAMQAAQRIMSRSGLAAGDVADKEGGGVQDWGSTLRDAAGNAVLHPVYRMCSVAVVAFCGCVAYTERQKDDGTRLVIVGEASDVELATWLLQHLRETCEAGWSLYKGGRTNRNVAALRDARIAFLRGFCEAVNGKLKDWLYRVVPDAYKAVTACKVAVVHDVIRGRGITLTGAKAVHKRYVGMDHAAGAGANAARNADFGRGVATAGGKFLIGK